MHSRRELVTKLMLLLRNLEGEEVQIKDIEFVFREGSASGIKLEIGATEKPGLKLVKKDDDD